MLCELSTRTAFQMKWIRCQDFTFYIHIFYRLFYKSIECGGRGRRTISIERDIGGMTKKGKRSSSVSPSSNLPSMKSIVSRYAIEDTRMYYEANAHSALGDAKSLARLTLQSCFYEDFLLYSFKKEEARRRNIIYELC